MRVGLALARAVAWCGLLPVALAAATQHDAMALGYRPQLGTPWLTVGSLRVYPPWSHLVWSKKYAILAPHALAEGDRIFAAAVAISLLLVFLPTFVRRRRTPPDTHGSARWATTAELDHGGFLGESGVVLCQTGDARFTSRHERRVGGAAVESVRSWRMRRAGRLIRHDGPEHVFVFAPTGLGKGIAIVVPTLLAWVHSVLVYDTKKELWNLTSRWRATFSRCWRFEPTAMDSTRFNPLLEIRPGLHEVRDTQNVADLLVDPNGDKPTRNHWELSAHRLLVGTILHVLYAEEDRSLTGVLRFLTSPARTQVDTLQRMLSAPHLPTGPHPTVAGVARDMLNKADKELSGVFSTAIACLGLYEDPIVARNTSASDFAITDLVDPRHPTSLYIVVAPSDIDRTRPLVRLFLNQICRRLTESIDPPTRTERLLLLLDEFPSLGRLAFFESALAFVRGYGLKCMLIAQTLEQLEKAYGAHNSILSNCGIRVAYTANDDFTARRISDLLGQGTRVKRHISLSGDRGAPWFTRISESDQEVGRPLMTPGEVLQLPFDEALVMVTGLPPYRAKKVMYYLDDRFIERVGAAVEAGPFPTRSPSPWQVRPLGPRQAAASIPGDGTAGGEPRQPPPAPLGRDAFDEFFSPGGGRS